MNAYTLTAPANGAPVSVACGGFTYLFCRTLTVPGLVSFDGDNWLPIEQNDRFGPLPKAAPFVMFKTTSGLASTINFQVDTKPITTQVTAVSAARSYTRGNFGIANGAAAVVGPPAIPACSGIGQLAIPVGMNLFCPGINSLGQRRQQIIFSFCTNSGLTVSDVNGNTVALVSTAGQPFPLPTDADLYLSGTTGTSSVVIGEIFLLNQS